MVTAPPPIAPLVPALPICRMPSVIVVVSDATHLFRIRELCKDAGLEVYTSPRPTIGHISNYDLAMRYFHEIVSYTALRLNLNI